MEQTIFAVSEVNEYIKNMLDTDERLNALFIRGELSNYKVYPSGHHYFTLKDETGALRCVMFRSSAVRLRFRPENGMKVIAFGRITVFPRDGAYQLYCADLTWPLSSSRRSCWRKGFSPANTKSRSRRFHIASPSLPRVRELPSWTCSAFSESGIRSARC